MRGFARCTIEGRIPAAGLTLDEYERSEEELDASVDLRFAVAHEYERYWLE